MKTRTYTLPVEQTEWVIPTVGVETIFNWDYEAGREKLLNLYEKGKAKQWNANERIDWSHAVDPSNPLGLPDFFVPIYGTDIWDSTLAISGGGSELI